MSYAEDGAEDKEVEQIIPIGLQDCRFQDDESDHTNQTEEDHDRFKEADSYTFLNGGGQEQNGQSWHVGGNDVRSCSGHHGLYSQLPPTINIFACPPPPPPQYGLHVNPWHQTFRPKVISGMPGNQIPNHGFTISIPANVSQTSTSYGDDKSHAHIPGIQTPPPPNLTTPFQCEDVKPSIPTSSLRNSKSPCYSRFHPYQSETTQRLKTQRDISMEKKSYLCVDTQDFTANEISVKVKGNKLTIEGNRATNQNCGRFTSMKHEFTYKNTSEAKNTSCSFHPNGTLVLQFVNKSDNQNGDPGIENTKS